MDNARKLQILPVPPFWGPDSLKDTTKSGEIPSMQWNCITVRVAAPASQDPLY